MGRGRAKAKQTKVARRLKYNSPEMDLESLQRELAAKNAGDDSEDADGGRDDAPADRGDTDDD
ncbi:DUF3073 domain-containing protein [Corynebacterium otitidis]|uniref:DUF3073 domain-containing protein n=1 Tax=Corynebacterium otitidis ATCC 51513 TaxID=883169 RepID=K0YEP6_9CORY|nr:DUF3073 domain-containing protein [Corynebacterium otitidis]EJZ81578.1 hypothetical protein HMPREF9719_01493 [Corynebacterium otitidis ATCC 51513]KKO84002.1 hypothetical protein AAV33_03460 [Corynebacterium otitidis]